MLPRDTEVTSKRLKSIPQHVSSENFFVYRSFFIILTQRIHCKRVPGQHGLHLLIFFMFLFMGCALAIPCMAGNIVVDNPKQTRHILIINSYHQGFKWTDDIVAAATTTISAKLDNVEFHVEYMDSKRNPDNNLDDIFFKSLALKYQRVQPDIIITSDDKALDFTKRHHQKLFPGIPVIFCGVNNAKNAIGVDKSCFAGLVETLDIAANIELARLLLPKINEIVVVSDATPTGIGTRQMVMDVEKNYPDIRFTYLNGEELSTEEMLERLRQLKAASAVIAPAWYLDKRGVPFDNNTIYPLIADASPVPVFGTSSANIGLGIIGGKVNSGTIQGEYAANQALRILSHQVTTLDLPVETRSQNRYIFDYQQLVRFSIDERLLPYGAIILNRPVTFYRRYRIETNIAAVTFIALLTIIAFLMMTIKRRQQAEKKLFYSMSLTHAALESTPNGILIVRADLKIARWNQKFINLFHIPKDLIDTIEDDPMLEYVAAKMADPEAFLARVKEFYSLKEDTSEELLQLADGRIIEQYSQPLKIRDEIFGRLWSFCDITDRRRSEEALRESEESLRGLFRALPLGVGTIKDRVVTSANERMWEITGYPPDEIIGHETRKLYANQAEFERVGKAIYDEIAGAGRCFVNACWRRKDGLALNVLLGAAVAHEGAASTDIVLSVMDITEQQEKEVLYRLLFEEAHDGLFIMNGTQFVDCNASALQIYGVKREQLMGASPMDFSPEKQPDGTDSQQAGRQRIMRALDGEAQFFEWRHLHGDGTPFDAEISLNNIPMGGRAYLLATVRDVTERKLALEALKKSEDSLSSLFRAVPTGIGVIQNRVLVTVNDQFCEIFGYHREELLGQGTRQLYFSEEEFQECGKAIYNQLETLGTSSVEAHMVRKDGGEIYVLIRSALLPGVEGGVTVTSSVLDITERKRALAALQKKDDYLTSIFKAAPVGIAVLENRVMIEVNDRFCEMLGHGREELMGQTTRMIYPSQEEFERCGREIYDSIDNKQFCSVEGKFLRKDGQEIAVLINGSPRALFGTGNAVTFSVLDITESKRTLKALQENEQFLVSIFRCTPTGIGVLKNQVVMTANDRFCEILGYPREEIVGQEMRRFYASEEEYQRCGRELHDTVDKFGYASVETLGRRKDGQVIHLLVNTALLPGDEGESVNSLSMMDITERKKNEEALKRYKDELEEMVKERTEELADSNAELHRMIEASADRSEQTAILNEMGELLQACETEEETYRVAVGVCAKLFSKDSGCLGILDADNWSVNIVGSWGDGHSCRPEFDHSDCWAIRRGKAHMVLEPETDPLCMHVRKKPACGTLCVPMNAQGKVLGMAHMLFDSAMQKFNEPERRRIIQEKRLLLSGLVERYAPSLVNLRLRESLREQSIRDRLTGLFNRRHMEEALNRELARARRRGASLVVVMIDVDHFKRFNDTYGHETGDEVLRRLGEFLTSTVRMEDIPCRYGGEELMLILPECTMTCGLSKAEDVRKGIQEDVMVVYNGERLQVTASLGVASFPLDGENMESLIAAADKALYRAKEGGRNKVVAHKSRS